MFFTFVGKLLSIMSPAMLSFFTIDRMGAVLKMFGDAWQYAKDLQAVKTWEELYDETLEFLCKAYDDWDEVEKYSDGVDNWAKGTLFPAFCALLCGGNHKEEEQ